MHSEYLKWDSDFFDFPVYRLRVDNELFTERLQEEITLVRAHHARLLYVFCAPELKNKIQKKLSPPLVESCECVDEKVTFVFDLKSAAKISDPLVPLYTQSEISCELRQLAVQSGKYSRFVIDKKIPSEKSNDLFIKWIEKSKHGSMGDVILVWPNEKAIQGMLTLKLDSHKKTAAVGIIAVNPAQQGQGIASRLVQAAKLWAHENGAESVTVVTQKQNLAACALYHKEQFKLINTEVIFHVYFPEDSK